MKDPVKIHEDKIRYDYSKKDLTFEDYVKQRRIDQRNKIIFAVTLCFFIYISFTLAFMYSMVLESKNLWRESGVEMAKGVCEEMGEDFINLKVQENPDETKRVTVYCSDKIKMFFIDN